MRYTYQPISIAMLMILFAGLMPRQSRAAEPRFYAQTGHRLAEPMLGYWERYGGLPVFGYPLSEAFDEPGESGAIPRTQYFERHRFEAHPENGAPYQILLGRLGAEALARQGRPWESLPRALPEEPHFFAATGHAIAPPFWDYWSGHGLELDGRPGTSAPESLALWGYPITEPALETNSSGDQVLTQWFERARFEYHPDQPPAARVLLGLLGSELTAGRRAEPPFQPLAPDAPSGEDLQWVSQRIFAIFNQVRAERGLPPYEYRADLQPLADQAIAAWTAVRQAGGDDRAIIRHYNATQFNVQSPWADWEYASLDTHLQGGICRNIDPHDPLVEQWRYSSHAKAEYRTITIGVFGPYDGPCHSQAVSVGLVFGQ